MPAYVGPIIDVDLHHRPKSDTELATYLPAEWRELGEAYARTGIPLRPHRAGVVGLSEGGMRGDAYPSDGSPPGADYELTCSQLLDRVGVFRAVLSHNNGEYGMHSNPYFSAALCRAVNDWNVDTWLGRGDDRLWSGIVVAANRPEDAVREVKRFGDHPRMAEVLVAGNHLGRPLGDPLYHPIYEAASESGLPIAVHITGGSDFTNTVGAAGTRATGMETYTINGAQASHYITSFIMNGVFEKFPGLKVIMKEFTLSWLPTLLWNLDRDYELLRRESAWVKRLPSEYVIDHIRLSTQPLEAGPKIDSLSNLLGTIEGVERMLCFSSDYPHFSMDDPTYVARHLPESWRSRVFYENACDAYGWDVPADANPPAVAATSDS